MKGYAEDVFNKYDDFNKFNLSNIFEYIDGKTFAKIAQKLVENGVNNAKYAYWNLMVPRELASVQASLVPSLNLSNGKQDKGFFYSKFLVNQKLC